MTNNTYFRPFNFRPVIAESKLRATHRTAYASYCYIRREPDADMYGPMPQEWGARSDLVATGRIHPAQTLAWARSGPKIWKDADASVTPHHLTEAAAFHLVLSLPPSMDAGEWVHLIETFGTGQISNQGMIADWAIHHKQDAVAPHAHLLVTARSWRTDRNPGRSHPRWFAGAKAIRAAELAWVDISGLRPVPGFLAPPLDQSRTFRVSV